MPAGGYNANRLPRPSTPPGIPPPEAHRPLSRLSYGVVCSSNINRSMEAHLVLGNAGMWIDLITILCVLFFTYSSYPPPFLLSGLRVESYGTGTQVRYVQLSFCWWRHSE